ncbi:MAG: DUF1653 domain-containing protein [Candidatus Nanoarchaeia archaeon]
MNDQPLKVKGYYLHYKNKPYKLLGIVRHSETLEEMIHYRALYTSKDFGKKAEWVRPKEMFFENLTYNDKEVPRFKFVGMTSAELKLAKKEAKPQKPAKKIKNKTEPAAEETQLNEEE